RGAVGALNAAALPAAVRRIEVPVPPPGHNGKAVAVVAGWQHGTAPRVVIADEDVRWPEAELRTALRLLDHVAVVRPQNVFSPAPWHARWDTARSLINRAFGGDWPGTVVVRRDALPAGWYDTRVLFENFQLVRTVQAGGGTEHVARGLMVPRRPPTVRRFLEQRVRQAYDSQAQPLRVAVELALLPAVALAAQARRGPLVAVAGPLICVVVAEVGRRRDAGAAVFPPSASWWAPLWVAERAVCAWVALGLRLGGGVRYAGTTLRRAAAPAGGPEEGTG
ncbi:MAG TPA: glycosyltransferase family 2 protein, partial [Actinotalea sp.]|nr:glycosyltransferase family 2 protein [Actinotalea sp.]